jgi:hypothetical protein
MIFIQVNDHLSIRSGTEPMAFIDQTLAQLPEIVDLSVQDDPDGLVFVVDRLLTRLKVDDAEPSHTHSEISIHEDSLIIRSTMPNTPAHPLERIRLDRARWLKV